MVVILPENVDKAELEKWDKSGKGKEMKETNSEPSSTHSEETLLIRLISSFFRRWAYFIADNAVKVIIVCSVLSAIGAAKMATTPNQNDITGWTPYGARSLSELAITKEFFGQSGQTVAVLVLILDKLGGNMLTKEKLKEVKELEEFISTNFTIPNRLTGKRENFREFCYSFCQINEPLVQFTNGYLIQEDRLRTGDPLNDRIDLQYPTSYMYGRKMSIQPNFFGVELHNDTEPLMKTDANSTELSTLGPNRITNMRSVKMIALQIRAERASGWSIGDIKEYEQGVTEYFHNSYHSDNLTVYTLSTTYVESEVVRAGYLMLPIFGIGFCIMLAVSSVTTFISAAYMQQLSIHKFSLALFACICPFMACGCALGFLFIFGVRFGSVLCISPFLVLAIGVDDAYLMIHAWQRVAKKYRSNPVAHDSPGFRLAEVLTDTGPAICISALTNILADTVGTFTGCPEVTLLSYGNMACIGVDFLYQISFYAAVMAIAGRFEIAAERQQRNKLSIEISDDRDSLGSSEGGNGECCAKVSETFHDSVKNRFNSVLNGYVNLVNNKLFDAFVFFIWAIYIGLAIYGITILYVNLSPKKLFAGDSDLIELEELRSKYIYPHYVLVQVFVNNPGNLSDPVRINSLNKFVSEFESLPGAWGPNSTNYFLRDFQDFESVQREIEQEEEGGEGNSTLENKGNSSLLNINDIDHFIEWPEYQFWRGFIRTSRDKSGSSHIDRFFFTTAFHGKEFLAWKTRSIALKQWRGLIDKYSDQFNATVWYDESIYIDLMDNMPTDTWQSAVGTLSCMSLICFVFMFDMFTVSVATAAIASVMAGCLGLNSLMGMELDPIVMASLVISIGFSVDIPAHVSYHFYAAVHHLKGPATVRERLRYCLASVGFPAIQAAISTNLCVVALLFADIYTSEVFVRVMVSCVSLCLIHGLLIIPCAMSLLSPMIDWLQNRKRQDKNPPTRTTDQ